MVKVRETTSDHTMASSQAKEALLHHPTQHQFNPYSVRLFYHSLCRVPAATQR